MGYLVTRRGMKADTVLIKLIDSIAYPTSVKEVQKLMGRLSYVSRFISRYSKKTQVFFLVIKKGNKFE